MSDPSEAGSVVPGAGGVTVEFTGGVAVVLDEEVLVEDELFDGDGGGGVIGGVADGAEVVGALVVSPPAGVDLSEEQAALESAVAATRTYIGARGRNKRGGVSVFTVQILVKRSDVTPARAKRSAPLKTFPSPQVPGA